MKHARPDYDRIQDPLGAIPEDEPVFLLRGQDVTAPATVEHRADLAEAAGAAPTIVSMARAHADKMRAWQEAHGRKTPDLVAAHDAPFVG